MNYLNIVMPKITSSQFNICDYKNNINEYSSEKIKNYIKNDNFNFLSYGTKEGKEGFYNFNISYNNSPRKKTEAVERKLVAPKTKGLLASVDKIKKQVIEEFHTFIRKTTNITKYGKNRVEYKTIEELRNDGLYRVIRTKNGEFISGYECYLNNISKTAKKYSKLLLKK